MDSKLTPQTLACLDQDVMTLVALYQGVPVPPARQRPLLARDGPSKVFR